MRWKIGIGLAVVIGGLGWMGAVYGGPGAGGGMAPEVWVHGADTDGDGLYDSFETAQGLDPQKVESFPDGTPDEYRLAADGRTMWEVQEAELNATAPGRGSGGGCGATGMEAVLVLGMLRRLRRRKP